MVLKLASVGAETGNVMLMLTVLNLAQNLELGGEIAASSLSWKTCVALTCGWKHSIWSVCITCFGCKNL
jgi:hypothetical protein